MIPTVLGAFLLVVSPAIIGYPCIVTNPMLLIMVKTALLYLEAWDLTVLTSAATVILYSETASVIVASVSMVLVGLVMVPVGDMNVLK